MQFYDAVELVEIERAYQLAKWGDDTGKGWSHFLLILQGELQEAIDAWQAAGDQDGRDAMVFKLIQVAAVAMAALTTHVPEQVAPRLVRTWQPRQAAADGKVARVGASSHAVGQRVLDCPHDPGTDAWAEWVQGWVAGWISLRRLVEDGPPNE